MQILKLLDEIFSGRLTIYNDIINNMNILRLPFGSRINENVILDNYYLTIFMYFGYVGYLLWAIFYYKSQKKLCNNEIFNIIQIIVFIYGLTDSNVIVSSINFMLSIQFLALLYDYTETVYKSNKNSNALLMEKINEKNKYNYTNV